MTKKLSFFSLSILIIAAIDSIRNLPSAALFGNMIPFFFLVSAIIFLIPAALVSAELSSLFPDKGGVYHWLFKAFGKRVAMTGIWLQWVNTMVWYPSFLSFIAGTFAYLIDPNLISNKTYLASFVIILFWTLTFVNLKGIYVSARINNVCAIIGTIIPLIALIALGIAWIIKGSPLQISITADTLIPSITDEGNWVSLVAIMASFLGIELAGVHVNDIKNPKANFPKAIFIAALFMFISMVGGSLAIAFVLPADTISLIAGVPEVLKTLLAMLGLPGWFPIITGAIVVGAVGNMINWLISPAKGLLHAAQFGFLPPFFTKTNKAGVAYNILFVQALLVSIFCLLFQLFDTINQFYWFLTALSTELYMIMYLFMFAAGIKLHYHYPERIESFKTPGHSLGVWISCILGCLGCSITIIVSFFPPSAIQIANVSHYFGEIAVGNVLTLTPLLGFFLYEKYNRKKTS